MLYTFGLPKALRTKGLSLVAQPSLFNMRSAFSENLVLFCRVSTIYEGHWATFHF